MTLKVKIMTLKMTVKVTIMDSVLAPTTMHTGIWCKFGECGLKRPGVITLTRMNLTVKVMTLMIQVKMANNGRGSRPYHDAYMVQIW